MVEKDEPMVPTDINGLPLAKLTPKQHARAKELEYERLMKTANKGIYSKWTREEKQILVTWAQENNYDLTSAEFKDIVEAFISFHGNLEPIPLRSLPKIDGTGRELDVLCTYCARVHSYAVPVGFRGTWDVTALCIVGKKQVTWQIKINDEKIPIASWEKKWLGQNK